MSVSAPTPSNSVLGLALTLDPASPFLNDTLSALRSHPGAVLDEPRMPFAALMLETTDTRRDHAWLESLPGVVAVDVVFVEVLTDEELVGLASRGSRRRSRDPIDDSPLPADDAVIISGFDFPQP